MATIPPETKELILAQTDLVDLVNGYVPLQRAGSQFRALCPFHNEKSPSFYVTPATQRYKCFGCQASGDAIAFLMNFKNMPFPDALRELAQRAGVTIIEEVENPEAERARRQRSRLLELQNKAARHMHELLVKDPEARHARAYLRSRGYGKEMAEHWLVGWMPDDPRQFLAWAKKEGFNGRELCGTGMASPRDEKNPRAGLYVRFRNRLMFPIHNDYGDIIAFSGRQLVEDKKSGKYINSPETALFKKSKVFFGLDKARRPIGREKFALLCEGQIDVIACHEAGLENAIAGLGTALTSDHARLLKRYTDTAILCYDSDAAGHKAVGKAFNELSEAGLEVKVAPLPEKEDPDSLIKARGPEAFRALLEKASGFFDYQIDHAILTTDLSQPVKKANLAKTLAIYLKKISDPVTRDSLMAHCATRLGLGLPEFRETFARTKAEKVYQSPAEDEPARVEAKVYEPSVLLLCQLALQSLTVQDWLCEQTESLLETVSGLSGAESLARILGHRPNPGNPAALNRFLGELPPEEGLTLADALEKPAPASPLDHAIRALNQLAKKSLQKRLNEISSQLKEAHLDAEKIGQLLNEANEINKMLRDSNSP
ncbi:DNA primase [Roseibacillus ishigakijimensis]|uniref:DNA primase n=1 Tax=Roseibacillus ishigakijimensis TaxID=454146 RepID=A0A934RUJ1_9BACT|nr:DNA primase [Roseibacillus ishigakijimensis]MBK1834741.1 DNA primase [Roseibacillus ishigakijimensis]